MLVEAQKSTLIDSCSFHPYKHAMDGRLPSLSLDITNPRFTNPFPGLDPRNLHHLPAALDPSGVPKDELFGPSRAHANQDVLQRLQNHSLAASAFTPTTPSVMRRDGSIKYQPSVPGFGYGDFPSSPVKPSTMGHLPQIPAGFSVATPLSVPRQMLPYGYSPMTMIPPGLGPAGYPPFMHMLSAASHILPFGYPTKKMFRCTDCRYMTDRKNNLKRHMATMHGDCEKVLECCDIIFKSKASLREHVLLFHQAGYRCRHCGRNFCRKALLKRHLAVHNGRKEYCCEACDYATSHKSNLERHRKVHDRSTPTSDIDDQDGYLPEPEDLLNQQGEANKERVSTDNDSFEDNSEGENEDIEVSEVDHGMRYAKNMTEHDIANSNKVGSQCINDSMKNNIHLFSKQFEKQSGAFDDNEKANPCQVSAFDKVNHDSSTEENGGKHKNDKEKNELYGKTAFEYSNEFLAKNARNVCTRCSKAFKTEHEFVSHKTICLVERDVTSGSYKRNPDPPRIALEPESSKRRRSTETDEQEAIRYNEPHHIAKRWAFPTTGAEIAAVTSAPDTSSQQYSPAALRYRMSVITPYDALRHERIYSQQTIPHTSNINFKVDLPKIPSTLHPASSVQRLHDTSTGEDQQNKQCLLPIRKPVEQDVKEPSGFGKELDQRDAAKHMINDVDGSQQQSSHEHSEDELDDKALPLKKRCVLTK